MSGAGVLIAVNVALAVAYQGYISWQVYRSGFYTGKQRLFLVAVHLVVPPIGAPFF